MTEPNIGNSELISAVNARLVMQAIRRMQPTFRAAVARQTGLKPASVTSIVNDLIDRSILREVTTEAPNHSVRSGRPPLMLEVDGSVKRILSIDLEPDRIRVALTDLMINLLSYQERSIDRFSTPDVVCEKILSLCRAAILGLAPGQLLGVGVSLPGLVDAEHGVMISSTNMPQWSNVAIRTLFSQALTAPVRVERSSHLSALYERWSDPRSLDRTILMLSVRTGIGASLIHRGELYTGQRGFDGEIGHTVVDLNGPRCECGNRGCLETFVSTSAILQRARDLIQAGSAPVLARQFQHGQVLTPEMIYSLARNGDAPAVGIVRAVGKYLGFAAANLINLLAPDDLVICGSIDMAGEVLLDAVREQVNASALPRSRERVVIRLARQQEKLPLLGAAVLVAQDLFELPRLRHRTHHGT